MADREIAYSAAFRTHCGERARWGRAVFEAGLSIGGHSCRGAETRPPNPGRQSHRHSVRRFSPISGAGHFTW